MANKNTVATVGSLAIAAIIGGAVFGGIVPIQSAKAAAQEELDSSRATSQSYIASIQEYQNGGVEKASQAQELVNIFNGLVPGDIDIESASRAIASALPEGVTLNSFNFGATQPVGELRSPELTISGFSMPSEFTPSDPNVSSSTNAEAPAEGEEAAASGGAVDPNAGVSGFNRVPFTIEVTADNYRNLSEYLDSLGSQPRLLNVVSIDSTNAESVTATIYAFAYLEGASS